MVSEPAIGFENLRTIPTFIAIFLTPYSGVFLQYFTLFFEKTKQNIARIFSCSSLYYYLSNFGILLIFLIHFLFWQPSFVFLKNKTKYCMYFFVFQPSLLHIRFCHSSFFLSIFCFGSLNCCNFLSFISNISSNSWKLDSCAMDLMNPTSQFFHTYTPCPSSKKIVVANGSLATIVGFGDIHITPSLILKNVQHVLKLSTTLFPFKS